MSKYKNALDHLMGWLEGENASNPFFINAKQELAALRAAAELMAERLRELRQFSEEVAMRGTATITSANLWTPDDEAALAAWDKAKKG